MNQAIRIKNGTTIYANTQANHQRHSRNKKIVRVCDLGNGMLGVCAISLWACWQSELPERPGNQV